MIVNPCAGRGITGRRWDAIESLLRASLGPLRVERTRGPRDAERIAREAAARGAERVILAGGDGTVSEVVSGLLAARDGPALPLGLIPLGTGGDLGRTLGLSRDARAAVEAIAGGKSAHLDAGRARFRAPEGGEREAGFLNVGSVGLSGLTTRIVHRGLKRLGGRVAYFAGALRAVARYTSPHVSVRLDGELIHDGPLLMAAAANGRYFGGGMHLAPRARIDDGLFDVVVIAGLTKGGVIRNLPSIYRGAHLDNPAVRYVQGRCLEAEAHGDAVWIELDGEPLGMLPARFEVLPGAIELIGVSP